MIGRRRLDDDVIADRWIGLPSHQAIDRKVFRTVGEWSLGRQSSAISSFDPNPQPWTLDHHSDAAELPTLISAEGKQPLRKTGSQT